MKLIYSYSTSPTAHVKQCIWKQSKLIFQYILQISVDSHRVHSKWNSVNKANKIWSLTELHQHDHHVVAKPVNCATIHVALLSVSLLSELLNSRLLDCSCWFQSYDNQPEQLHLCQPRVPVPLLYADTFAELAQSTHTVFWSNSTQHSNYITYLLYLWSPAVLSRAVD